MFFRPVFFFALLAVIALVMPYASADGVWDATKSEASEIGEKVSDTAGKIFNKENAKDAIEKTKSAVGGFWDKTKEVGETLWKKVSNSDAGEKVKAWSDSAKENVKDVLDR